MERLNELALFAGAGGGLLGSILNGWRTVCAVEIDDYCRRVLLQRQADGCLEPFPIWDDVRTFDGRPWRGCVDIVTGGFPCQDISAAGKGAGIEGERSGLWSEFARIIGEVRPRFAFVENSPMLTVRGLGRVLGDLAAMGFDAQWGVVSAADCGARHRRERIWIMGYSASPRRDERQRESSRSIWNETWRAESERRGSEVADADSAGLEKRQGEPGNDGEEQPAIVGTNWWSTEPDVGRVADGVASRVDRLRAIGNGQVPLCMAMAFRILSRELR